MNLAECANATGNQALAYQLLGAIRKRAGIPAGTNGLYGLAASMSVAQMETAITNERRIEFAFEDKRYDDLRRTRTFDQLNGTIRMGFFVVPRAPYFCSTKQNADTLNPYNLDRYIDVSHTTMVADTINVNGPAYQTFFRDSMNKIVGELPINFQTTYYAYGIPSADIGKDLNLQQTLGWMYNGAAGTFDPTK
jgi:starch-binding outer membrane protein, SusD/RagB family